MSAALPSAESPWSTFVLGGTEHVRLGDRFMLLHVSPHILRSCCPGWTWLDLAGGLHGSCAPCFPPWYNQGMSLNKPRFHPKIEQWGCKDMSQNDEPELAPGWAAGRDQSLNQQQVLNTHCSPGAQILPEGPGSGWRAERRCLGEARTGRQAFRIRHKHLSWGNSLFASQSGTQLTHVIPVRSQKTWENDKRATLRMKPHAWYKGFAKSGTGINPGSVPWVLLPEDMFARLVRSSGFEHCCPWISLIS